MIVPILFVFWCISAHSIESKVVKYTFEVYYFSGAPDGVSKNHILGINGQFPGPTIEATVGDYLEITLINKIQDGQNTTIHWHGLYQKGFLFEDGTSQIAQCPLPSGASQLYRFNLTNSGTYWYHSHVNSQYTEGLFGALVVHKHKEVYNYDGEITLILSDWYHRTAHENEKWYLSPLSGGISPYPDSALMNGFGRYPCHFAEEQNRTCHLDQQFRPIFTAEHNATYRIRVVNAGAVTSFNFSIDSHILKTIEVDGIDVATPVATHIVPIAPGQRYSFIVSSPSPLVQMANQSSQFLIRATVRKADFPPDNGSNINKYPQALIGDLTAVLEYVHENLEEYPNRVRITKEEFSHREIILPPSYSTENGTMILDEMLLRPSDRIPAPANVTEEFSVFTAFVEDEHKIRRGSFNETPFQLPHGKPLLMTLLEQGNIPSSAFPLEVEHQSVVQLVINNRAGIHPFHLHGHHFWVVGKGKLDEGDYNSTHHNLTLTGVKRDTVVVLQKSWAVIRFIADNPGIWTFHCHMDWHNLSGMALTFVEAIDVFRRDVRVTEEALRVCQLHN